MLLQSQIMLLRSQCLWLNGLIWDVFIGFCATLESDNATPESDDATPESDNATPESMFVVKWTDIGCCHRWCGL